MIKLRLIKINNKRNKCQEKPVMKEKEMTSLSHQIPLPFPQLVQQQTVCSIETYLERYLWVIAHKTGVTLKVVAIKVYKAL